MNPSAAMQVSGLFAQTPSAAQPEFWNGVVASVVFGLVGVAMLLLGFFLFELLTRKLDVEEELKKGNLAVAMVVAALLLAVAYIVGAVVH